MFVFAGERGKRDNCRCSAAVARVHRLGSISVTRNVGLVGAGCFLGLYVDGKPAAHFETGERAVIALSAGRHVITSRSVGGRGLCGANSEERQVARSYSAEIFVEAG